MVIAFKWIYNKHNELWLSLKHAVHIIIIPIFVNYSWCQRLCCLCNYKFFLTYCTLIRSPFYNIFSMCFCIVYVKLLSNEMSGNQSSLILFFSYHNDLIIFEIEVHFTWGRFLVVSTVNSIAVNSDTSMPLMMLLFQIPLGFTEPSSVDFPIYCKFFSHFIN